MRRIVAALHGATEPTSAANPRALVPDLAALSGAERALLSEWLDRVSGS